MNEELWRELQADMETDVKLRANWSTTKDWKAERRYERVSETEAKALYEASADSRSADMQWIRKRW